MATVTSDTSQTLPDGSSIRRVVYDDGSSSTEFTPAAGSPVANQAAIQQQALAALAGNRTFISAAKPSTAAAQASQAYDQAVKLSRQNNGLIRLLLGLLDGTD